MTQKDYIKLARALRQSTPLPSEGTLAFRAWMRTVNEVINELKQDNTRFDQKKFMRAVEGA
jgi:hypothetical protein